MTKIKMVIGISKLTSYTFSDLKEFADRRGLDVYLDGDLNAIVLVGGN